MKQTRTLKERPSRVPAGGHRNILTVQNKDPNYEYRWVNDDKYGQRLQRFRDGGWEIVEDENVKVGEKTVDQGTKLSTANSRYVGGGVTAVLMRIPKEWYDADQKAKWDDLDAKEASMKQGSGVSDYGKISIQR